MTAVAWYPIKSSTDAVVSLQSYGFDFRFIVAVDDWCRRHSRICRDAREITVSPDEWALRYCFGSDGVWNRADLTRPPSVVAEQHAHRLFAERMRARRRAGS